MKSSRITSDRIPHVWGLILTNRCPCLLCRKRDALLQASKAIKRRTNVEGEDRRTIWLGRCGIVIYDIAHFLASLWTTDNPVMTIEWWLVVEPRWQQPSCKQPEAGFWRHLAWSALKFCEMRVFITIVTSLFPLQYFLPCLLVQKIMYLNHSLNMLLRCFPTLSHQRIIELLRRGIFPLSRRISWDGRLCPF